MPIEPRPSPLSAEFDEVGNERSTNISASMVLPDKEILKIANRLDIPCPLVQNADRKTDDHSVLLSKTDKHRRGGIEDTVPSSCRDLIGYLRIVEEVIPGPKLAPCRLVRRQRVANL